MNCLYCTKSVVGMDAMTVASGGPAHRRCFQFELVSRRVFRGIPLAELSDTELNELQELIQLERNSRNNIGDDVELF